MSIVPEDQYKLGRILGDILKIQLRIYNKRV